MAINSSGWYKDNMRPMVTIGNTPILDPWEYNATTSTIVDSARNVKGKMIGAVIRDDVAKIECTWQYIPAEEWSKIIKLFSTKHGGSFINNVTFYNQDTNDWETRECYVSDRTAKVFLRRADGSIRGYQNARIALVEV